MTMEITIASIDRKEKQSFVHTADGRKLRCWNDKIGKLGLEQAGTFEVETDTTDYGTFITKAKRVAGASAAPTTAKTNGNGHYRPTAPEDSERMFVCSLMNAFIQAGKIEPELGKVTTAINVLRTAYQKTFGSNAFLASEAGHNIKAA